MAIDNKTVSDIAHLCRLELDEEKNEQMKSEMNKILDWMQSLDQLNTDDVQPLIHMSTEVNILRDDEEGNLLEHSRALKNAPKKDSNYFRVPKVIE